MKLLSLTCNHCGAPIDVPHRTKYVTCAFCDSRLQVTRSGTTYYTEVMEAVDDLRSKVEALEQEAEIDRLDRRWERRQIEISVRDKHGVIHRPTVLQAVVGAGAMAGMAIFMIAGGFMDRVPFIPVLLLLGATVFGAVMYHKAHRYDREYAAYRARRRQLMQRRR